MEVVELDADGRERERAPIDEELDGGRLEGAEPPDVPMGERPLKTMETPMGTNRIARPATARSAAGLRPGEQTFASDETLDHPSRVATRHADEHRRTPLVDAREDVPAELRHRGPGTVGAAVVRVVGLHGLPHGVPRTLGTRQGAERTFATMQIACLRARPCWASDRRSYCAFRVTPGVASEPSKSSVRRGVASFVAPTAHFAPRAPSFAPPFRARRRLRASPSA